MKIGAGTLTWSWAQFVYIILVVLIARSLFPSNVWDAIWVAAILGGFVPAFHHLLLTAAKKVKLDRDGSE